MLRISPISPHSAPPSIRPPLEGTDKKVYEAVVEKGVIAQFGALLTVASTICYFLISTHFAWGIALGISAIALSRLDPSPSTPNGASRRPSDGVGSSSSAGAASGPFVDGQPIGLRREGNNCSLNSIFQFLLHAPGLRHEMQRNGARIFRDAFLNYQTQQVERRRVATTVDTQTIREWFAGWMRGFSANARDQEDAQEALGYLMQNVMPLIDIHYQRPENEDANAILRSSNLHTISLRNHNRASFDQVVANNYMQGEDDVGYFMRQFASPPPYLVFHLDRFGAAWRRGEKINDQINMGVDFRFPGAWAVSGEEADYTCTAFIEHQGRTARGGHYVAYVCVEGQWWLCDDTSVTKVSTREAQRKLGSSYIAYYQRT